MRVFFTLIFLFTSVNTWAITESQLIEKISSEQHDYPHYEMGVSYLSSKNDIDIDYEKALFWLAKSSEIEKFHKADYLIAEMYSKGKNPSNVIDMKKTLFFLERSANRGNKDAKLKLATYYFFNEKTLNKEKGVFWLNESKKDNSQVAELFYYLLVLNESDYNTISKQLDFLKIRSKNGDNMSNFTLGYLYFSGKGVKRDFESSKSYFIKALAGGILISNIFLEQIDKLK